MKSSPRARSISEPPRRAAPSRWDALGYVLSPLIGAALGGWFQGLNEVRFAWGEVAGAAGGLLLFHLHRLDLDGRLPAWFPGRPHPHRG